MVRDPQVATCAMVGYGWPDSDSWQQSHLCADCLYSGYTATLIVTPTYLNLRFFRLFAAQDNPSTRTYWPFILMAVTASGFRCGRHLRYEAVLSGHVPRVGGGYTSTAWPFTTFVRSCFPSGSWTDCGSCSHSSGSGTITEYVTMLMPGRDFRRRCLRTFNLRSFR